MSIQAAVSFISKVAEDAELYQTVKQLESANLDQLCATASAAGFEFTQEDWKGAVSQCTAGAVSDDELDQVSGGAVAPMFLGAVRIPAALSRFAFGGTAIDPPCAPPPCDSLVAKGKIGGF